MNLYCALAAKAYHSLKVLDEVVYETFVSYELNCQLICSENDNGGLQFNLKYVQIKLLVDNDCKLDSKTVWSFFLCLCINLKTKAT